MSEKLCENPGVSFSTEEYRVTVGWDPERGTYFASASLFDEETDAWVDPFEWGTIKREYPYLFPIPFLVSKYIDDASLFSEELITTLKEMKATCGDRSQAEEISPIIDFMAEKIRKHREDSQAEQEKEWKKK